MATKKKGILTSAPQWWDHLKDWKRVFWSAERKATKKQIKKEINDDSLYKVCPLKEEGKPYRENQ
jgi:hypothetical protein